MGMYTIANVIAARGQGVMAVRCYARGKAKMRNRRLLKKALGTGRSRVMRRARSHHQTIK